MNKRDNIDATVESIKNSINCVAAYINELEMKNEALEAENHLLKSMLAISDPEIDSKIHSKLQSKSMLQRFDPEEMAKLKEQGLTDDEVATKLGCSRSTIARFKKMIREERRKKDGYE